MEPFSPIEEILAELRSGRMVVLTDDEDRENEGDLVLPAQFVTPESITFMLSVARGYMCLSLTEADCDRLELVPQATENTSVRGTPFTVSIDGHPRHGFTTGVSAGERARTILMAIDPSTGPGDFVRPGHINPLRARDGGVLVRIGQTEGSLDLCRLAGLQPSAVIIEVMRDDGEMARVPDLASLCREHGLKMCSVRQVIEHRLGAGEGVVQRVEPTEGTPIETSEGSFVLHAFSSVVDPLPHLVLTLGELSPEPTLVRVHRRELLGDIFGVAGGDESLSSGQTLRGAMRAIQREGRGAIVYLRPPGIGDELGQVLLRPSGHDDADRPHHSVSHSMLEYGIGSQILRELGLGKLRLLTNSSTSYPQLDAFGLEVVERVAIEGA